MIRHATPLMAGLLVGTLMVWMVHQSHLTGSRIGLASVVVFVAAHVGLAVVAVLTVFFAARLSTRWRARLDRLHRPSLRHIALMVLGMGGGAVVIHLFNHGGLV